jgi:hypothetical protein
MHYECREMLKGPEENVANGRKTIVGMYKRGSTVYGLIVNNLNIKHLI